MSQAPRKTENATERFLLQRMRARSGKLSERLRRLGWFWLLCALLYWGLVGKVDAQQMAAAGAVGLAVSIVLVVVAESLGLNFPVRARWLAVLGRRLPGNLARDIRTLTEELWRGLGKGERARGAYSKLGFEAGGEDGCSAMRRALVFGGLSVTPNTLAVEMSGRTAILIHHFGEAPASEDKEFPV